MTLQEVVIGVSFRASIRVSYRRSSLRYMPLRAERSKSIFNERFLQQSARLCVESRRAVHHSAVPRTTCTTGNTSFECLLHLVYVA